MSFVFIAYLFCIMFGGVSDHLVLLLLINLIWFDLIWKVIDRYYRTVKLLSTFGKGSVSSATMAWLWSIIDTFELMTDDNW